MKKTKAAKKTVWVLLASSESGDNYGPYVLDYEPTEDELEAFWRDEAPGEWDEDDEEGPGFRGSWLHPRIEEVTVLLK